MSYPNSIFNNATPNPIENKANWLGRYLAVEKGFSSKLQKVLSEAAVNIDEYFGDLVNDNISTKVARVRIGLAHKEIRRQMREIFGSTGNLIKHHQQDAAVAAVNAKLYDEKGILSLLFPDPVDRSQYADSLRQTARRNIESTIVRAIFTEKPLSERVYRTEALANGLVSKTVNNALARGDSAKNLAKDVRALIDPNVPGGVSYAAMRLGRTEINNAFHAQSIIDTQDSPWVHEMRWYLSKRHEKDPGDECETYAATGTFRKEDVPEKPHPNCRCFVTPELPDYEDFERSLISGYYDPYLDSVMGQGYSEETRAKPISGQFAATKKKKPPAEPAKWTGPKVGKPLSNEPLVERNLEKAWQSTKFDDYKKNFRIGGREAQRIGYGKFPTFYKDEITERIQDGTIDNLLDSDPSVLKAYGKEIVARAVHSEPITKPIYRGMIIERADLLDSQVGRTVAMPLSSFDTEEHWAIDFAQGRAWQSEDVKKLKDPVPVLIQLEPGAKVANLKGSERVAFGQFDVEEILPPKDVKVIRLSQEEITERPTVLVVRQTSMLEPETIGGRMAEGKSNEEIDKEIKEFQVVDDASKMKGVRPNAATRQALSKLKEVLPKTKIVTAKASLNSTVLSEMATAYSELNEDFPEILDNYKALAFGDPGKGTFGETKSVNIDLPKEFKEVTGRGSTVIFNTENFASKKKLKESVAKTVFGDKEDEKYKPQQHQGVEVDPVKTVVVHEFGHQMAIALGWGNPKSIFSTFNQKLFDVYDKTVAKSDEDRTGEKLNAWLEKIISELPPYGSVIGSETGQPPLAWNEVDLNEAFPISFESARLRPEKAKFIEKLMHDFLVENYEKFIKGRKKENA